MCCEGICLVLDSEFFAHTEIRQELFQFESQVIVYDSKTNQLIRFICDVNCDVDADVCELNFDTSLQPSIVGLTWVGSL
jgi:hypothetical protein